MSKYHRINWRESDEQELKRVIRNFNAKISRLEKKNPQKYNKNTLPTFWDSETETYTNKMSVRQMKELINTRQDLKRELNALKRFSKRGSEEIVSIPTKDNTVDITKWQRNEMRRRASYINRRRAHRLEEIENTEVEYNKQKLGYTRKELGMGKLDIQELKPINAFNPSTDNYNVKARFRSIMKQSQTDYFNARDYMLRENFIKSIEENYRKGDIGDVINHLKNMDIKEFLNEFNKDPNAFEWNYPPNEEEYQSYLSRLKATWIPIN